MTDKTTQPPRQISETEMRDTLARICARNPEEKLLEQIAENLLDPAKPREITPDGEKGHARPHPLLVALGGVLLFTISAFLYFSFWR